MRGEIEPRLDRLVDVERVIADLHVVEHPRPHQRVLVVIAEADEEALERLRPDAIGTVEGLAHVGRAARPFPNGEIEARAEDGRIDPAAKDVANRLIDGRRRLVRLAHDRAGVEAVPAVEQGVEKLVAILEIPVEARPRHAEPFAEVEHRDMRDPLDGKHAQRQIEPVVARRLDVAQLRRPFRRRARSQGRNCGIRHRSARRRRLAGHARIALPRGS